MQQNQNGRDIEKGGHANTIWQAMVQCMRGWAKEIV